MLIIRPPIKITTSYNDPEGRERIANIPGRVIRDKINGARIPNRTIRRIRRLLINTHERYDKRLRTRQFKRLRV